MRFTEPQWAKCDISMLIGLKHSIVKLSSQSGINWCSRPSVLDGVFDSLENKYSTVRGSIKD